MKFRKLYSIIAVLFVFGQMAAFAEDTTVDYSNASVSIKYYNRTVYYPGTADSYLCADRAGDRQEHVPEVFFCTDQPGFDRKGGRRDDPSAGRHL